MGEIALKKNMSYDYIVDCVIACCHWAEGTKLWTEEARVETSWISSSGRVEDDCLF